MTNERSVLFPDSRESPPLTPYPSWEAHESNSVGASEIVSTFRVRADRCNRLWVLDTGLTDILGSPEQQVPPTLLIYDLTNDRLMKKFVIPEDQRTPDSLFANLVVEDYSCDDAYGYLGDLGGPGLVVYSLKMDKSWLVKHHFFHPDPQVCFSKIQAKGLFKRECFFIQGGEFNVSGVAFQWTDGIFGMALAPTGDGYSILYFHPLSSTMEFSVSTKILRDPEQVNSPGIIMKTIRPPSGRSVFQMYILVISRHFPPIREFRGSRGWTTEQRQRFRSKNWRIVLRFDQSKCNRLLENEKRVFSRSTRCRIRG